MQVFYLGVPIFEVSEQRWDSGMEFFRDPNSQMIWAKNKIPGIRIFVWKNFKGKIPKNSKSPGLGFLELYNYSRGRHKTTKSRIPNPPGYPRPDPGTSGSPLIDPSPAPGTPGSGNFASFDFFQKKQKSQKKFKRNLIKNKRIMKLILGCVKVWK